MSQCPPARSWSERLALLLATFLYELRPSSPPTQPRKGRRPIRIVCVSDTHNATPALPAAGGDILLHAGDLCQQGTLDELRAQIAWLDTQPFAYKVTVGGNHDEVLARAQANPRLAALIDWKSVTYLVRATATLAVRDGTDHEVATVRVHGDPRTPKVGPWTAFAYPREEGGEAWASGVPTDTDVLLTHGPPSGYRDVNPRGAHVGCAGLLAALWAVPAPRPRLLVCGHLHECAESLAGPREAWLEWDALQWGWEGVLLRREGWWAGAWVAWGLLVRWARWAVPALGRRRGGATRVVNAAVAAEAAGPVIVEI